MKRKHKKIVIGVDQSYTRTGISVGVDGKLVKVTSLSFKGLKTPSEKRNELRRVINLLLSKSLNRASEVVILCERIRTFSQGAQGKGGFGLRPDYIKSTGALIAVLVDTAFEYNVKVYSVDTRSWKSRIVGTSKGGKMPTVKYVQSLGFDLYLRTNKKGEKVYDDDGADSACIALYGFLPEKDQKLKLEK